MAAAGRMGVLARQYGKELRESHSRPAAAAAAWILLALWETIYFVHLAGTWEVSPILSRTHFPVVSASLILNENSPV